MDCVIGDSSGSGRRALPEKAFVNEFAPLSRGQANTGHPYCHSITHGMSAGASYFVSSNTFATLGLSEPLLRALAKERFVQPTPIQACAIPHLLADRDLLGIAQTGTGETAAFALPMLQHLISIPAPPAPFV